PLRLGGGDFRRRPDHTHIGAHRFQRLRDGAEIANAGIDDSHARSAVERLRGRFRVWGLEFGVHHSHSLELEAGRVWITPNPKPQTPNSRGETDASPRSHV